MSLVKTLGKMAVGMMVAKAVSGMAGGSSQGSGGSLGGLLGGLLGGGQKSSRSSGGDLGGLLGGLLGGQKSGGGGLGDVLGGMLGGQSSSGSSGGGLGGLIEGLAKNQKSSGRQSGGLGGLGELIGSMSGGSSGGGLGDLAGMLGGAGGQSQGGSLGGILDSLGGGSAASGGLGGLLNDVLQGKENVQPTQDQEQQAEVMLRAMISAAKADGDIDAEEQQKIGEHLDDVTQDELDLVRSIMREPNDLQGLVRSIPNGMEQQAYFMSLLAIDLDSQKEANYLDQLAKGLNISPQESNSIHEKLGAPVLYS
ncbi:MAG: DUF533 domain-containing protein [Gammaproteobacteria bacterium]